MGGMRRQYCYGDAMFVGQVDKIKVYMRSVAVQDQEPFLLPPRFGLRVLVEHTGAASKNRECRRSLLLKIRAGGRAVPSTQIAARSETNSTAIFGGTEHIP
ncbi:hypothetical protein VTN31DRAFT_7378 [Thermomyces dupontii]|uniref:uncharacterized protein n=1 Tax=Talaromyces thermophilus TaxID=28565 RepID=UPI003742F54F